MKIELRGVSKHFGTQSVLANVSTTLEFPHTLALIGPSGGGKSTLLRLLSGLITPDAGSLVIDGHAIPDSPEALRSYRARIGIVFQAFNLFPHLSALENILLPLTQVHHVSPDEASARARAVLARFHLAAHAEKRPAELSGGQRQRVAIARAIAIQPKFLLFDEPTSALDPEMTAEVLDLLAELRSEGRPMILVTHAMGFARHTADLVAFVSGGTLLEVGQPEQIFGAASQPEVRQFLERVLRY
jgi:polar amino acid transport system ATP-binding protein